MSISHQQVEKDILKYDRLLAWSPRSDPDRPSLLYRVAALRRDRFKRSHQKGDLDKSIAHLTETILIASQPSPDVVHAFYALASSLISRFPLSRQPEDVRSSLQYLRFLRINFHPLEAFGIRHGEPTSGLIFGLAQNLVLGSGEMMRDMEEMVALIPEFLASDAPTHLQMWTFSAFAEAVNKTDIFRRKHTQQVTDRIITILREATVLNPDSHVSFALASCLSARF